MIELSLLDSLTRRMGCEYISDLRFLSKEKRRCLAKELMQPTLKEDDIQSWNETLSCLTGEPPVASARDAGEHLVHLLCQ